jgi:diacylglycerol O-acyltransferase
MTMQPLEGLDAAFLALETTNNHLHVAAVLVLDPPEGRRSLFSPSTRFTQIRRVFEQRVHLVPQLRQRAVRVPFGLYHPVWVDDPEFNLDDHVRRASIPAPGGPRELDELVAEVMGQPLDPERPLWEMVVVEGLANGRMAIIAKLHHAILDGVSGASLLAAFLDFTARDRPIAPAEAWDPEPLPRGTELIRYAMGSIAHQPAVAVDTVQRSLEAIVDLGWQNRRLAESGDTPPPAPFSAPRTSLNGTISLRRRFASLGLPLEDARATGRHYGATINDVVLAAVGGALRRLLDLRGEDVEESLVAMVPVSTRHEHESGTLGNRVSGMLITLATTFEDPIERLNAISTCTKIAKSQELLTKGRLVADLAQISPPALSSRLARWANGFRVFDRLPPLCNVTISSVRGPETALWCAGSRIVALYPVGPIADGVGLNVTVMSYLGSLQFGLLGCRHLVPEVQDLAIMIDDAMAELVGDVPGLRDAAG